MNLHIPFSSLLLSLRFSTSSYLQVNKYQKENRETYKDYIDGIIPMSCVDSATLVVPKLVPRFLAYLFLLLNDAVDDIGAV